MADPIQWPGTIPPIFDPSGVPQSASSPLPPQRNWFDRFLQDYRDQYHNSIKRFHDVGPFGILPPPVRESWSNGIRSVMELTPGASIRDTLQSSGELSRAVMNLDPVGTLQALGGMTLGAAGLIPGERLVRDLSKKAAPYLREGVEALTKGNPRGLPMDPASRRARAEALGFDPDKVFYHATGRTLKRFDPNKGYIPATFFSDNPHVADSYLERQSRSAFGQVSDALGTAYKALVPDSRNYRKGSQMYPVVFRDLDKFRVHDYALEPALSQEVAVALARKDGYPGVIFKNMPDGGPATLDFHLPEATVPSTVIALIDPAFARSTSATFDPRRRHSSDLLAGLVPLASVGMLAPYLSTSEEHP